MLFYNVLIDFPARFSFNSRAAGLRRHSHLARWFPVGSPPLGEFFLKHDQNDVFYNIKYVFSTKYFIRYWINHKNLYHKILKKNMKIFFFDQIWWKWKLYKKYNSFIKKNIKDIVFSYLQYKLNELSIN